MPLLCLQTCCITHHGFMYPAALPGSTSEPKGVMITHRNLADNLKLIVKGLCAIDDTVVVSWLPQARIAAGSSTVLRSQLSRVCRLVCVWSAL